MFNPAILKKKKKATEAVEMDKHMAKHAMHAMAPKSHGKEEMEPKEEMETSEKGEKYSKKKVKPESKLEIEIMLQAAKKKKK